ncbi:WxL protein peptidoglycan domain-containing protein [Loigolactobacillus zhaoyuanensis]|uniref:WxL protein peptidoglycan domain-containing protein n=1 Tax=Loigolactobacillus zhaoyuanensis TaxID=2486017 RepID=A0ABW8UJG9_9LACO
MSKKIHQLHKGWLLLAALLLGLLLHAAPTQAAIDNIAVVPQTSGANTERFQLIAKPGATRQLKVTLTNFASNAQTITMAPRNATTTSQGKILFNRTGKISGAPDFRQMVKVQRYTLAAKESRTVTITVRVAQAKFSGLLIGGLHFYVASNSSAAVDVPVWLTETNKSVTPKLALAGLDAQTYGGQPYLIVNLENQRGALLKNVTVDLKIKHYGFLGIGSTTSSFVQTYKNFAPYSRLPLTWGRSGNPVKSGRYQVTGTITSQGKQWYIKQRAVLDSKTAKAANAKATNLTKDYTWLLLLVVGLLVALNAVIVVVIIRKRKQK